MHFLPKPSPLPNTATPTAGSRIQLPVGPHLLSEGFIPHRGVYPSPNPLHSPVLSPAISLELFPHHPWLNTPPSHQARHRRWFISTARGWRGSGGTYLYLVPKYWKNTRYRVGGETIFAASTVEALDPATAPPRRAPPKLPSALLGAGPRGKPRDGPRGLPAPPHGVGQDRAALLPPPPSSAFPQPASRPAPPASAAAAALGGPCWGPGLAEGTAAAAGAGVAVEIVAGRSCGAWLRSPLGPQGPGGSLSGGSFFFLAGESCGGALPPPFSCPRAPSPGPRVFL